LNKKNVLYQHLSTITDDGGKLSPYISFKGKSNEKIENELKKAINIINKNCFIDCKDNEWAWATEDILSNSFNNIWNAYLYNNNDFNE